jgi:hypothetical protein
VPTPQTSGSGSKRVVKLLVGAAILSVVIGAAVIALVVTGVLKHDTKKLAIANVQVGVQQVLADRVTGYNADDIKDVKCNNGQDPTVQAGQSFRCDVTVRGKQHQLTVTFPDDSGAYEVGLPELSGGQ